ncbi:hypothetical protein A2Y99_02715 [Candidatus Gottesmanbacteria bacterium RBG_13_37_7]|uniref:Uncharacterized protein n=1 Tax=Candidatus Gottesmanbacteria bacterium RBG_13_37_7 TaxID=1798369 RepID=A0A1F5YKT3_9BACT|nr:MAG: hypothetical protein A2Y99_02715 [Candidatus Gottesmanbacteria bacterium RBG_13_37_7]
MVKIIKKIISEGLEVLKDSGKQIADTVSPDALLNQALGGAKQQQKEDEFTSFLKNSSPDISPEELEKKKKELGISEKNEMEEARNKIMAAIPPHMRPPQKEHKLRPYEQAQKDEEQKKAQAVEAREKQPQPLPVVSTLEKKPGLHRIGKRQKPKGFEGLVKDAKVG